MFRFHKPTNFVTIFHKASNPASSRAHAFLKQTSATASEAATEDQASDHSAQSKANARVTEFELNVNEQPPTANEFRIMLESLGKQKVGSLIPGAVGENDALRKLAENGDAFQRPVTVDWSGGKVVVGDNQSEILKMLQAMKQS